MKTIVISAFDSAFFSYGVRMFDSVRAFHPALELYAGDLGLRPVERTTLGRMGVRLCSHPRTDLLRRHRLGLCFGDFLVYSFLQDLDFDQVMWIDADTMVLRPLDPAIRTCARRGGLVGHPGRHRNGLIWTMSARFRLAPFSTYREFIKRHIGWTDGPYLATGLWLTGDRAFLRALDDLIDVMYDLAVDSPVFSALANRRRVPVFQLDPDLWNFSRDLVPHARLVNGEIVYGENRRPYTVGFSQIDGGARLGNPALDRFHRLVIRSRLRGSR